MSKRKSMSWVELRVGLLVVVSFALLALAIFFISGQAGFLTPKYSITVYFGDASGVKPGAEVRLEGVTVGNVSTVVISASPDPSKSVEIAMRLDQRYQDAVRTDSLATIGTIGLLGDNIVNISRGSAAAQVIPDGGTLQGSEEGDIKKIITGTNDFLANLDVLSEQFQQIAGRVQRGEGSLGKLLTDTAIFDSANSAMKEANSLIVDARKGPGTVGRLMSDDRLYRRVDDMIARMDTIIAKVDKGDGTLGKFINDQGLYNRVDQLIAKADTIADRIEKGEGSLGRLAKDEALYNDAQKAMARISSLAEALESGEGTAGKLINDAALYNNLNQTSSEIMKLMYDFRQNPKKFLTISFKLF